MRFIWWASHREALQPRRVTRVTLFYDERFAREYGPRRPVVGDVADKFPACEVPVVAGLGLPARHGTKTANRGSARTGDNRQTSGVRATKVVRRGAGREMSAKDTGRAT